MNGIFAGAMEMISRLGLPPGLAPDSDGVSRMAAYSEMVLEASRHMNLTSIPEEDFLELAVVDSLSVLCVPGFAPSQRILDVGTGAGFPGVMIACALPGCRVSVLDSSVKKTGFVQDACRRAGITNVTAIRARAEEAGRDPSMRETFDSVVCRAFAALAAAMEYCAPFTAAGGRFHAMKGPAAAAEIALAGNAHTALGLEPAGETALTLPSGARRVIVSFVKLAPTPEKYPRRPAAIAGRPLS